MFTCPAMRDTIQKDCPLLQSFTENAKSHDESDVKLGGDLSNLITLKQRSRELALLLKPAEDKRETFLQNNPLI